VEPYPARESVFGVSQAPCLAVFPDFGPQARVSCPNLPEDAAGHLGRKSTFSSYVGIESLLKLAPAAGLAVGKSIGAHPIQGIAVSELGSAQGRELVGVVMSFNLVVRVTGIGVVFFASSPETAILLFHVKLSRFQLPR
jgi:hypothetical protein